MFINQKITKFIIILFCFNIFSSISQTSEDVPLNNIAIYEIPKPISSLIFEDFSGNKVNLNEYNKKLVILNFWATWCAPCKKEMPSLDKLYQSDRFKNLQVFAVNMEEPNKERTRIFFSDLNIEKLEIFFDPKLNFVKKFKLKGVPTTIIINKKGEEFARIIGEVNFMDKEFLNWLAKYD